MSKPILQRIRDLADPIAEELEIYVLDARLTGTESKRVIQVIVERLDEAGPGTGIQINEITKFTKRLNYELDVEDPVPFAFNLEVTSPGVERDLTTDRDWQRYVDHQVKVVGSAPMSNGESVIVGQLKSFSATELVVCDEDGNEVVVDRSKIRKARNVYDFSSVLK